MTFNFLSNSFKNYCIIWKKGGSSMSNSNQTNTPKSTATPTPREIRSGERPTFSAPRPPKK